MRLRIGQPGLGAVGSIANKDVAPIPLLNPCSMPMEDKHEMDDLFGVP